jgi:hypothetical protein
MKTLNSTQYPVIFFYGFVFQLAFKIVLCLLDLHGHFQCRKSEDLHTNPSYPEIPGGNSDMLQSCKISSRTIIQNNDRLVTNCCQHFPLLQIMPSNSGGSFHKRPQRTAMLSGNHNDDINQALTCTFEDAFSNMQVDPNIHNA